MAEEASKPESTHQPPPPPPFVEVECKISKRKRRFAAGTKAGFAVSLINRKLDSGRHPPLPLAFAIESVKDGEEPVSFGPDAPLVHYGNAWNLQAVTELDYPLPPPPGGENLKVPPTAMPENPSTTADEDSYGSHPGRRRRAAKPAGISRVYIAKILLAFFLIFVLGSAFTIALENLPKLILLLNSFM